MNSGEEGIIISIIGFMQGGAEIMPIRLANYLWKQGERVAVHCISGESSEEVRQLLNPQIPVFVTDKFWRLAWIVRRNGYRIIHTHCVGSQMLTARMKRLCPWLRVRHIATSHGGYEGIAWEEAAERIRLADRYTDYWTCVAEYNRNTIKRAGVKPEKCFLIGNGLEKPSKITQVDMTAFGIPEDAYVITVVTRAVRRKGWQECIEAVTEARRVSDYPIHLLLCGTGEVYEELRKSGTASFVHLAGEIRDAWNYYAASYCGMLLSVGESMPLGLIEMYYAGKPVIVSESGEVRAMVELDGKRTGILLPVLEGNKVSVKAAADAIIKMIEDKEVYTACTLAAMEKAKEYDMKVAADQYRKLFYSQRGEKEVK